MRTIKVPMRTIKVPIQTHEDIKLIAKHENISQRKATDYLLNIGMEQYAKALKHKIVENDEPPCLECQKYRGCEDRSNICGKFAPASKEEVEALRGKRSSDIIHISEVATLPDGVTIGELTKAAEEAGADIIPSSVDAVTEANKDAVE